MLARAAGSAHHMPVLRRRAPDELAAAVGEYADAGSGLIALGPVTDHLKAVDAALQADGA
ncbi:hypothetical protein [Streptomyces collinus]|uniref:hypothetical protein n=1 Tax=Streptomyces collinus TaxID=42684 RepID=UPI003325B242